jgi:23S rRNA pseudouridine1911/1915/1917 synthase
VSEPERRTYRVGEDGARRLDAWLAEHDAELTRAQVLRLIEQGLVTVNGQRAAKAGAKLRPGDELALTLPSRTPPELEPVPMALAVLHEDAHLIVLDKPAGLIVHPAPGHEGPTLVHGLLARGVFAALPPPLGERPGVVHRLDRDTSGVMAVARDTQALEVLQLAFRAKTDVLREYIAVCAPSPDADRGTLSTLYERHPSDPRKFSSRVKEGKPAVTHWEVRERLQHGAAVLACRLETGRTHQIRVHTSDQGWPLLGDPLYGRPYPGELGRLAGRLGRQALHAARLELTHPVTGERLRFQSDPPPDLRALLDALR